MKGSDLSTCTACISAADAAYSVCSHSSSGNLLNAPELLDITGCNSAVAMMDRIPCTPTSVTARSMLSTGWLLTRYIALFAIRSRLPVSAGSCAMMREISTIAACGSFTVDNSFGNSDGRRGMYSGRASMRSRICATAWNTGA